MVTLVREAMRRLRDNDAGPVELQFDLRQTCLSEPEVKELALALALNSNLTRLDLRGNHLQDDRRAVGGGRGQGGR